MSDFVPENPFPSLTSFGIVTDERCDCGHLRSQHAHTRFTWGHGPCTAQGVASCPCGAYEWCDFVFQPTTARTAVDGVLLHELTRFEGLFGAPLTDEEWNLLAAMSSEDRSVLRMYIERVKAVLVPQ